ncbi:MULTISPECIES: DeoR/GlpR family DNA-binding transcription regulator [Streptomyces]|uniref:DeoR/GlpR family DNA-binding transcription regulator n=5 Tax=Streptomyces TaxID=1883 RepID=A0ABD5JDB2_9ACTN|nr:MULTISPECIES: DeoR/GlpR family DNA-binding transcription regulator [Streptomyces]MEE4586363.1 DeoR/GlpR family DNA-binding transcription regulator [Streptomyces sp. DSM 41602]AEM84030.1 transcriptional regulator, DeoR family [Streptomyces violaceusniger Tu 4113]AJZ84156.1 DeoR/GlpR transcriptional regulator [Streptomyces sp. AgN23]AQW55765.1 ArsR family transcriptional regulator [Streptomyces hygroscopicus]ASQ99583.1 DeoR/GlpR transcriptional regulator [Streptomyces sp. 11-1-2]
MLAERRHQMILRALRSGGPAAVTDLSEQLGVSAATVRRDLLKLEEEGLLTRVHGGAVVEEGDQPFAEVAGVRVAEKDALAVAAADMIEDGQSVLLDIGTTAYRLARQLHGRRLTVITSNLVVFEELADDTAVELVLLGGVLRREYRSLVGFLTEDNLRQLHADWLFLGTSGVRPSGQIMDTTVIEVPVKRAMIAASDQVVLLADAGKFPGTGMTKVCGPEDLDAVVTNAPSDSATCSVFEQAGVKVVRV